MIVAIGQGDRLARCLIYPQLFEGNIHANSKLWEFGKRAKDGRSHQSAVLRRLAVETGDVHRIGCKISSAGNGRLAEQGKLTAANQRYYCGFREALFEDFELITDEYEIEFSNVPEFDEEAHVDVALRISPDAPPNLHATLRTNAGLALAERFGAVTIHRCAADLEDRNHPFDRLGEECVSSGLPGPWQNKTIHLSDVALDETIISGNWPGLMSAAFSTDPSD